MEKKLVEYFENDIAHDPSLCNALKNKDLTVRLFYSHLASFGFNER